MSWPYASARAGSSGAQKCVRARRLMLGALGRTRGAAVRRLPFRTSCRRLSSFWALAGYAHGPEYSLRQSFVPADVCPLLAVRSGQLLLHPRLPGRGAASVEKGGRSAVLAQPGWQTQGSRAPARLPRGKEAGENSNAYGYRRSWPSAKAGLAARSARHGDAGCGRRGDGQCRWNRSGWGSRRARGTRG